ncbi:MAG: hypothetical protein WED04_06890 [Promethearchaeati archaeon SRVP18_Atabeyarchaeia-1]
MLRSGKLLALAVVLVWFYVLLAALVNPVYTSPSTPSNPIMPFLTAEAIVRLWPLILISFPIVMIAGQRLVSSSGGRRQVSPQEFARIQARARATRQHAREDVGSPEPRRSRPAQGEVLASESAESGHPSADAERKLIATEELLRPPPTMSEPEFTPPPMVPRGSQTVEKATTPSRIGETAQESTSTESEIQSEEEKESSAAKRIDELEAERGAVATLMDRLEDMHKLGAIQPELYDKLKKKYIGELQKINAKVERLPVNEELRKKAPKK